jgi:hypothetical protein
MGSDQVDDLVKGEEGSPGQNVLPTVLYSGKAQLLLSCCQRGEECPEKMPRRRVLGTSFLGGAWYLGVRWRVRFHGWGRPGEISVCGRERAPARKIAVEGMTRLALLCFALLDQTKGDLSLGKGAALVLSVD